MTAQTIPFPNPKSVRVNWLTLIVLIILHVTAIAAFWYIDTKALMVAALLHFMCLSWGIGMGYHRLLTHRSFKCPKFIEYILAIFGTMTLEGGPIFWVGTHRIHHQNSDQAEDPHSPRHGFFWAHMGWIIFGQSHHSEVDYFRRYAPDLTRNRFYVLLNKFHYVPLIVTSVALYLWGGLPMLLWAGVVRVVVGLHATWLINSATHVIGWRRFQTKDDSRNSFLIALATFGEGWHNNHHAKPNSARHGLTWRELDITWLQIQLLGKLGIYSGIKVASPHEAESFAQAA